MPLRVNPSLCFYGGHLPSKHLNHRPPSALPPWTPSTRADRLAHFRTPMVERLVSLAVGQSSDDAVITLLALSLLIAWCFGMVCTVAECPHYLLLTPKRTIQPLTGHSWPESKSYEPFAGESWIVFWSERIILEYHLYYPSCGSKSSHAYTGARARRVCW